LNKVYYKVSLCEKLQRKKREGEREKGRGKGKGRGERKGQGRGEEKRRGIPQSQNIADALALRFR